MIVSAIQIETCGVGESLDFPQNFVDERQMVRFADETFVETSEVG